MSTVMMGTEISKSMKERLISEVHQLKTLGISPCLAIMRVGEKEEDLSYERSAKKRMEMLGIECRVIELSEGISQKELEAEFSKVNEDASVHGILLFRPLPVHLDEEPLREIIKPDKDVDCMSPINIAKVFAGDESGHAPCTAEAVMELLDYYDVPLEGKNVVIVGRSMIVGKPLSMLLLKRNATVTICHTKTVQLKQICREADILVAAAGKARMITSDMVGEGAVIADVGINMDEEGNLCGDVDYDAVEKKASYISPVPRGVGSVTTSVLAKQVVKAVKMLEGV